MTIWKTNKTEDKQAGRKQENNLFRDIEDKMYNFFCETALKNGYIEREKQYDMAEEVLDAIKDSRHLMVEAGVGIGKTFAYLVPALLYHEKTGKPIIIATSTIALQEQLKGDVETLSKMLGISAKTVIAKGQTNYVCKQRAREYKGKYKDKIKDIINHYYAERTDIHFQIPDDIWGKIRVEKYGRKCQMCTENCPYKNLREKLPKAGITICNQNLLAMHMKKIMYRQQPILNNEPDEIIIIDEAHNLEDKVREALQVSLRENSLKSCIRAAASHFYGEAREEAEEMLNKTFKAISAFFREVRGQMKYQDRKTDSDIIRYYFKDRKNALNNLRESLSDYLTSIDVLASLQDDYDYRPMDELEEISDSIEDLVDDIQNHVIWIEKDGSFTFCRDNIAEITHGMYFGTNNKTCILTSATLTGKPAGEVHEQYEYIAKGIGFDGIYSKPKESPFDYDNCAMMYVSDGLPHPTRAHEAFIKKGTALLKEILKISAGRALILFTSKKDMREVYESLKGSPFRVLMQQDNASQKDILDAFKEDEHAVLLGSGSYWEGINVEGQTLSNLIVFRLPFPVPDPIIDAREKRTKDPLMEVKVPEMIIKLKQGVGRLIRSETDSGIISIIDSRAGQLSRAPYKDMIMEALPVKNITNSLGKLKDFYNNL